MQPQRARQLLARERARIEQSLSELEHEGGDQDELSNVDQHQADAGSELHQREQDAGVAIRLREELDAIDRAEHRLEQGIYGRSIESDEPIPDARLEVVPWAERTVGEQERLEQSG